MRFPIYFFHLNKKKKIGKVKRENESEIQLIFVASVNAFFFNVTETKCKSDLGKS